MNVCGTGLLLRTVFFALAVTLVLATPAVQAQSGSSDLVQLADFDAACSKDGLDSRNDAMCRQAMAMALGKEPLVEEVRTADGRVTQTQKTADPDPAKAGWLGEEACEHGQWQSCMLYATLLEHGDGVPLDAQRSETLVHYACAKGHRLACQSLHQKGIIPASVTLPERPTWVKRNDAQRVSESDHLLAAVQPPTDAQRTDEGAQARAPQQAAPQPAPAVQAATASNAAPAEATLIAKCLAAARDACYDLARGYERGDGMPRDPARSALYYEKACDAGHGTACAQLGRRPATTSGSSATSLSGGMLVAIAFAVLVGVAVVVLRRRGAASDGGGPRPAPVRPALPRSSR